MDLQDARKVIDEVNTELVPLIERRMDAVVEVTRYKRESGMAVYDAERERLILERVGGKVQNPEYKASVQKIFQALMDVTKEYEEEHL